MHQDCRELNLVHILRVQTIDDTVGQSDGGYNNSGGFYMSSYLKKYFSSRNNNIGPVRFQLILLDTLFGRELSIFHIYLAVIFFYFTLFHTERELSKFSAEISMRDVIVITIFLRTYYNVYLLFLYISRNTYIRKSIGTDSVKKYRIYENNELFPYSYSLCTCDRIGTRDLAKCGC